nr:ribonuclease H-like domain-containing protein [Tanacetum cinerariifolium]
ARKIYYWDLTSGIRACGELLKPFLINSNEKPNLISLSKMSDHENKTIPKENAHPKVVPQITTVTNISAKFPYLKKGDAKSMTTDNDGNLKIRPPKFKEFKISEEEGLDKGYDKMHKILTQMNILKIKPDPKDINMKFLRGLPPSWSGIALILKNKAGLEYISFDDLYNKLKFLEIDTKGYSTSSSTLSNATFVSTAGSSQGNLSYQESRNSGHATTFSVSPGSSSSKGSLKSKCSVVDDMIYSFFANHETDQHLVYEELDQMNKEEFKEYDLKHQMAMLSIKDKQTKGGNTERRSLENLGMIAGIKIESDADSEGEVVSADDAIPAGACVPAGTVPAAVVSPQSEAEFAFMGLSTEKEYITSSATLHLDFEDPLEDEEPGEAKWNNSGRNLYKLIDSSMSVRTKRGLGLDKYIGEGELGIDDSKVSIFHTDSDDLEWQPIYNRFALVDHMKAVPPSLIGNYMPPSNIPDIDESQMVYGKKATDSSEIKTNDDSISYSHDSVLFDFSDSKTVYVGEPNPLYAGQPNPVSAGEATLACNGIPLSVSAGDGILGPRPLNIQPKRNKEADQLGLAFPSLNPILGVGSALIGYSVSTDSTPPISVGSTPLISLCASLISTDRHFISVGKCHVSARKPTGSAGIPVSAGRPSGSVARTPILTEFETLMQSEFEMSSMGPFTFFLGLQVDQRPDGIFIHQENDYAGANRDRKSTIGGCQFLGRRLISWQCKKQTIVATSFCEAEYVAAASCCEDGPIDYPMDGGDDEDDDDGDSFGEDADDEDEKEEEEHLAPTDSAVVVPAIELISPPKGT